MISFGVKYWFILLLAVLAASVGVALLLYFRNKNLQDLSKTQIRVLMALRFLSFFMVAFLLLAPFIKTLKKITRNPVVLVAWDNSASMLATPDSANTATVIEKIREQLGSELPENYSVVEYTFGENAQTPANLNFKEKKSDYGNAINTLINNHFNENIGAMILVGDGIYNQGKNPVNLLNEINFPVYTIGFGDTTEIVDSRIQDIRANRTSFSGNKFPVEIDTRFSKLKGKNLKLSVMLDGREVATTIVTPPNQNFFFTWNVILDAGSAGLKHFSAKTEVVENERNTKNNYSQFVINVLEKKQKILIISDGPHPDAGAIKNTLDLQTTYDVSEFTEEPYPANLSDYNLLILNQLPTTGKSAAEIVRNAEKNRIPTLYIVGNKTFLPQLNALELGITIKPLAGTGEEAQAVLNRTFAIFNLSDDFKNMLVRFPPLQVAFADYDLDAALTPMLYQKIMNIETTKPLLATGVIKGRKTGFILGEGIWRWRLFDYEANQNHNLFNEFVNQLVQYLALRQNEDNFIIDFKPAYAETDEIIMTAEVYNDAYEPVNSEEVKITIKNNKNEEFDYTFDALAQNYFLNAGHLPMGDYSFNAKTTFAGKEFNESGYFTVTAVNFEDVELQANHGLLYQMAVQSGGKFVTPNQTESLIAELKGNKKLQSTSYYQEMVRDLLNLKWIFAIILLLLSVEWFLRKYWGIY